MAERRRRFRDRKRLRRILNVDRRIERCVERRQTRVEEEEEWCLDLYRYDCDDAEDNRQSRL